MTPLKGFMLFIFSLLFIPLELNAQIEGDFLWKNRLLIILTSSKENDMSAAQLNLLFLDEAGLVERKLKVFQLVKNSYREGNSQEWKKVTNGTKWLKTDQNFEVVLIGLDGGIKRKQNTIISRKELYDLIDSMPMRKNEMRRKGKG